jgi:hypothetical protein
MKISAATTGIMCILIISLASAAFAQTGVEQNAINVKIDSITLQSQDLPYKNYTTLSATLNNTSTYLSGTIEINIVIPPPLRSMLKITGPETLFLQPSQTQNITLTIQNNGTLPRQENTTLSLQVKNAAWLTTDKKDFPLNIGANPDYEPTPAPPNKQQTNETKTTTLIVICLDKTTQTPLPGITIEITPTNSSTTTTNTTNSAGQCTLQVGNQTQDATAKAQDQSNQYLSATQQIQIQPDDTQVTFYLEKTPNSNESPMGAVAIVGAVAAISLIALLVYNNKLKKAKHPISFNQCSRCDPQLIFNLEK